MARSDLIILDDFGLSKMDSVDRMSLLEILEDRWGQASTIVVSQRPFTTWHEVLESRQLQMLSAIVCSLIQKKSN
jgi:DNA replication protein DnaC